MISPQSFHLIDLISQACAEETLLRGQTHEAMIAWVAARGMLRVREVYGRQLYDFSSPAGGDCTFFLDQGQFVFLGDHMVFTA